MGAGPPGADVEIWVQGEDMRRILAAKDDVMAELKTFDGLYQVQSDYRPGKRELKFTLKPGARTAGANGGRPGPAKCMRDTTARKRSVCSGVGTTFG